MKPFKTSRNSCLCGVCIIIGAAKTLYGGFWLLRPSWFENERQSFFVKTGPNLKSADSQKFITVNLVFLCPFILIFNHAYCCKAVKVSNLR